MLLFVFFFTFCLVGHLTFFHIYYSFVNFSEKLQYFIYTREGSQNYVFIYADRKWFMPRKNRNIWSEQNLYKKNNIT